MTDTVECVVIGAGVAGLAIARAIALKGHEVLLLEAEETFGTQTSSRNSEVIHAGIYYPSGSLKALSCVRGKTQLYDYCRRRGVNHRQVGKLIVATSNAQVGVLESYLEQGRSNGVDDLELLSAEQLLRMEPEVRGVAALWSPSTGIIDSHGLMLSLLGDFENAGGTLVTRSPVSSYKCLQDGFEINSGAGDQAVTLQSRWLVNAAGHGALPLAEASSQAYPAKNHYPAGHYFSYSGKPPFRHLVYPVAEQGSLGVHATLDLGGQMKFGPDVEWRDSLDYAFGDVDVRLAYFEQRIRQYYPSLETGRLQPGYVGIRPRITGPGEPGADFVIAGSESHNIDGLVQLFGIESPGLTACLAIADQVVTRLVGNR